MQRSVCGVHSIGDGDCIATRKSKYIRVNGITLYGYSHRHTIGTHHDHTDQECKRRKINNKDHTSTHHTYKFRSLSMTMANPELSGSHKESAVIFTLSCARLPNV